MSAVGLFKTAVKVFDLSGLGEQQTTPAAVGTSLEIA